uniref:Uncharacterized protein n=1 Tax=Anguilla anguilla TaxID=7936 RepID=A0A0E9XIF0_ANGAN
MIPQLNHWLATFFALDMGHKLFEMYILYVQSSTIFLPKRSKGTVKVHVCQAFIIYICKGDVKCMLAHSKQYAILCGHNFKTKLTKLGTALTAF